MSSISKIALSTLFASFFTTGAYCKEQAEQTPAQPPSVCESNERFNDFDFWLGEWNVYSNDDKREFQGTNSISKQHRGCLIMENWTNAQGGTGSSMNYYDAVEDQWRQLWVAGGYSIDYTGGLDKSGSMVLSGKINYYKTGKSQAFRGRWTPNADGSVRQFFEQQDTESHDWS
ncbi:MAG: hypothetical protein WBS20_06085, partial [Lysobacterales bacterium]